MDYRYIINKYNQELAECNALVIGVAKEYSQIVTSSEAISDVTKVKFPPLQNEYFSPRLPSFDDSEEAMVWENQLCISRHLSLAECLEEKWLTAKCYKEFLMEVACVFTIFASELASNEIELSKARKCRSYDTYKDSEGNTRYLIKLPGREGLNAACREIRLNRLVEKIIAYTVRAKATDLFGQQLLHKSISQTHKSDRARFVTELQRLEHLRKEIFALPWPSDKDPVAAYEHGCCAELKLSLLGLGI